MPTNTIKFRNSEVSHQLSQNEEVMFVNNHDDGFGSFTLEGLTPGPDQKGSVILVNVPDDGHVLYFDVNHNNSFQLKIANTGDVNRDFHLSQGNDKYWMHKDSYLILRSEPFSVTWDTEARSDRDVRVTISVVPMAEDHGAVISYQVVPLKIALEQDEAERLAKRNFLEKLLNWK